MWKFAQRAENSKPNSAQKMKQNGQCRITPIQNASNY